MYSLVKINTYRCMSTQNDNFINELKYDAIKNSLKGFFARNIKKIAILLLFLLTVFLARFITKSYRRNKMLNYNSKIFESLASGEAIANLEKLYNDKNIPKISKTLAGLSLVKEYTKNSENDKIAKIYEDILDNEDDIYLKYYSGLNLLILKLNGKNTDNTYLENLFSKLENEENPLLDMVKEQKVLFLIKNGNYDDAKKIIDGMLSNDKISTSFKDRIRIYLDYIR